MTAGNDITEKENEAIEELKSRLKGDIEEELYDDKYLFLRFLRARGLNINDAEVMLRKHLEWREKNDIKNALNYEKKEVMEKYILYPIIGYDKEGCVIRYCPVGNLDVLGLLKSCTYKDLASLIIYEMEKDILELRKQSKKLGRNVDQCVYVCDFENCSFATATSKDALGFLFQILNIFINNYPEILKGFYIYNVSMYFYLVFAAAKPILPKSILDKIHIYSDDTYKEDLLKIIDANTLPAFLGGNKKYPVGDPLCVKSINHGLEKVPEKYYLQKGKHLLSKEPDVKKITLARASFYEDEVKVKEAGSYIEWEFETKCRDIGFGLFYNEVIDGEEKITELIPIVRIDTEEYPETGTYRCDKPGKYVILFDNTYSWVRQKEIYIRSKVLTPKEHEAQLKN